jgi:hypothetical protein
MADKKSWYKYTDESGKCWRIKTTARLAEIGGLQRTDESTYPELPELIKPRYAVRITQLGFANAFIF